MNKMITKTKDVDGRLWYYRADANEREEFSSPQPCPPTVSFKNINSQLYTQLVLISFIWVWGNDDSIELNNYIGHLIYRRAKYYYIDYFDTKRACLIARLITIREGKFFISKNDTIKVFITNFCYISKEPFATEYPIAWE